jgi:hypothetical protein
LYAPLFRPPAGGGSRGFRLPAAPCVTMRAGHRGPVPEALRAGSGSCGLICGRAVRTRPNVQATLA